MSFLTLVQVFRVTFLLRRRDRFDFAAIDATNLISIIAVVIAAVTLAFGPCRLALRKAVHSPVALLVYYFLFCTFSAVWASKPVFALYRAVELLVDLLLMIALFSLVRTKAGAVNYLIAFTLSTVCFALAWCVRNGSAFHADEYPSVAAMGFSLCWGLILSGSCTIWISLPALVLFGGALALGTSSGSNVATLCAVLSMYVLRNKKLAAKIVVSCAAVVVAIAAVSSSSLRPVLFPGKTEAEIVTVSSRTGFWEDYYQGFLNRPILGYGFGSGEKEADRFGHVVTSSSHNMLLSVAVNTGTVGLAVFLSALSTILWSLAAVTQRVKESLGLFGLLVAASVNSMTYPVLGSTWNYPTMIVFAALGFAVRFAWTERHSPRQPHICERFCLHERAALNRLTAELRNVSN